MIEADDAPMLFIPEKIKKFATSASKIESTISKSILVEEKRLLNVPWSKKTKGRRIIVVMRESMKRSMMGEVSVRIRWSITYTNPQVTAAPIANINPGFINLILASF